MTTNELSTLEKIVAITIAAIVSLGAAGAFAKGYNPCIVQNQQNYARIQPYEQPAKLEIPRDYQPLDSKLK